MPPASRPVLGSTPVVPETKICEPALTPWLNSGDIGAFGVVMHRATTTKRRGRFKALGVQVDFDCESGRAVLTMLVTLRVPTGQTWCPEGDLNPHAR